MQIRTVINMSDYRKDTVQGSNQQVYLTTTEVAHRWRLQRKTIERHAYSGRIPSVKISGRYLFSASAIEAIEARSAGMHQ